MYPIIHLDLNRQRTTTTRPTNPLSPGGALKITQIKKKKESREHEGKEGEGRLGPPVAATPEKERESPSSF